MKECDLEIRNTGDFLIEWGRRVQLLKDKTGLVRSQFLEIAFPKAEQPLLQFQRLSFSLRYFCSISYNFELSTRASTLFVDSQLPSLNLLLLVAHKEKAWTECLPRSPSLQQALKDYSKLTNDLSSCSN